MGIEASNEKVTDSTINNLDSTSILIFSEFSGPLFVNLGSIPINKRPRAYGPSIILSTAQKEGSEQKLPISRLGYPIYSEHLKNCRVLVTGYTCKISLLQIKWKIEYLGGFFTQTMSERRGSTKFINNNNSSKNDDGVVTHVVVYKCRGDAYHDAVYLRKPILTPDWVEDLWTYRDNILYDWNVSLVSHK